MNNRLIDTSKIAPIHFSKNGKLRTFSRKMRIEKRPFQGPTFVIFRYTLRLYLFIPSGPIKAYGRIHNSLYLSQIPSMASIKFSPQTAFRAGSQPDLYRACESKIWTGLNWSELAIWRLVWNCYKLIYPGKWSGCYGLICQPTPLPPNASHCMKSVDFQGILAVILRPRAFIGQHYILYGLCWSGNELGGLSLPWSFYWQLVPWRWLIAEQEKN